MYQLMRTCPGLSGAVQIDLVMNKDGIENIYLSSKNNTLHYIKLSKDGTGEKSFGDALVKLYKKASANFYSPIPQVEHQTQCPMIVDGDLDTGDHKWEYGCSRGQKRFGKNFELFIPMWCQDMGDLFNENGTPKEVKLNINIKNKKEKKIIIKSIGLNEILDFIAPVIDSKYETRASIFSDSLMNIDITKGIGWIRGWDCMTGKINEKNINYLINQILLMERPVMEFDNILLSAFEKSKMIASQIININILFNIDDYFDVRMKELLKGSDNLFIDADIKIGEKIMEKKDFFTNYDNIKGYDLTTGFTDELNVLKYKRDNECIHLINKNKIVQNIFHWSLVSSTDYTFNLYNGFAARYNNQHISGTFYDTPNPFIDEFSTEKNTAGWVDIDNKTAYSSTSKELFLNAVKARTYITEKIIGSDVVWFHGLKYNINSDTGCPEFRFIKVNSGMYDALGNDDGIEEVFGVKYLKSGTDNDPRILFFFDDKTKDNIAFKSFHKSISNYNSNDGDDNNDGDDGALLKFKNIIMSFEEPKLVFFKKSIDPVRAPSPKFESTEIQYSRAQINNSFYLMRYDGKIIPQFINLDDKRNYYYYIKQFRKNETDNIAIFNAYLNTSYQPNYPSIEFNYIDKKILDYFTPKKGSEKWFGKSKINIE